MKLAIVTPWPPMETGIADYAYDLVKGMISAGLQVVVVTEEASPKSLDGVIFLLPDELKSEYNNFDHVIYQMGNNSNFHLYMINLIATFPGIIHLHDLTLHHIMAWVLYAHGDQSLYFDVLNKWYGPEAKKQISNMLNCKMLDDPWPWDTGLVNQYPFFEEVIQHASQCIVHSKYAMNEIKQVFPLMECTIIPQVYANDLSYSLLAKSSGDYFQIGIFGGVDFNKRINVIISAIKKLKMENIKFKLNIVGSISKECLNIFDELKDDELSQDIKIYGRVTDETFLSLLSQMDLCIALRFPTMGETSAVVMRALQMNIPLVVSDVGWYSELPDFIPKIKPESNLEDEELYAILKKCCSRDESYKNLLSKTKKYSSEYLDFKSTINKYIAMFVDEQINR